MKVLLGVVLIALVTVQASAQNRPSLSCFDCADCRTVTVPGTPVRNCYSQETPPTTQTVPGTVGLTASTTVAGVPTVPATTAAPAQQSEDEPNIVEGLISQARNNQLYQCFFIQRDIGDRRITQRGCALVGQSRETTCRRENQGEDPRECQLCDEDNCNDMSGAISTTITSVSLILATLFIATRLN